MPRKISQTNTYTDKLVKLIPAEWISAYVALKGILESSQGATVTTYYFVTMVLLAMLPFYLRKVLAVESWKQIVITTVSFLVWVFSLGGEHVGSIPWYEAYQGSIILIIWTLAVPILVGLDPGRAPAK